MYLLEQTVQYISSTGPTMYLLEQTVQYISSTGPTMYLLEQTVQYTHTNNIKQNRRVRHMNNPLTGSRSTFEFPSQVNLSGPSLYYIARTLGK